MGKAPWQSGWADERFGVEHAAILRRLLPEALAAAVSDAVDAHEAAKTEKKITFGATRYVKQYESVVEYLRDIDGVSFVRVPGTFYELAVVNGTILLPFRFADQLAVRLEDPRVVRELGKVARGLIERIGAEPSWSQPQLYADFDDADHASAVVQATLERLGLDTKLVLVPFACNVEGGLLAAYWGEAALRGDGQLEWVSYEMLPIPEGRMWSGHLSEVAPIPGQANATAVARFDDAPLDEPALSQQTGIPDHAQDSGRSEERST
ncbi:hypothetical protein [Catelliglobosispora koreensis]|uniref:hypothetical protein n=1 Tax=Catelliglobosispora koreensis TaxID=129052 RepID=UPI0003800A74|nr:hypothetical protein [Catelliglobosispora koreensis]